MFCSCFLGIILKNRRSQTHQNIVIATIKTEVCCGDCNELLLMSYFDSSVNCEVLLCCFMSANCCRAVLNHRYAVFFFSSRMDT